MSTTDVNIFRQARIDRLFNAPGVYRRGHFVLTSGRHSDTYFDKRAITGDYFRLHEAGLLLADLVQEFDPEIVVSPKSGATLLGKEVAVKLATHLMHPVYFISAEKDGHGGYCIEDGHLGWIASKRIVVVEDILTTGENTAKKLSAVSASGQEALALVVLLDRSKGAAQAAAGEIPVIALKTVTVSEMTWTQCRIDGPCSQCEPICTEKKVGHGDTFVNEHGQPPYK